LSFLLSLEYKVFQVIFSYVGVAHYYLHVQFFEIFFKTLLKCCFKFWIKIRNYLARAHKRISSLHFFSLYSIRGVFFYSTKRVLLIFPLLFKRNCFPLTRLKSSATLLTFWHLWEQHALWQIHPADSARPAASLSARTTPKLLSLAVQSKVHDNEPATDPTATAGRRSPRDDGPPPSPTHPSHQTPAPLRYTASTPTHATDSRAPARVDPIRHRTKRCWPTPRARTGWLRLAGTAPEPATRTTR
jgi:hypothetical protein